MRIPIRKLDLQAREICPIPRPPNRPERSDSATVVPHQAHGRARGRTDAPAAASERWAHRESAGGRASSSGRMNNCCGGRSREQTANLAAYGRLPGWWHSMHHCCAAAGGWSALLAHGSLAMRTERSIWLDTQSASVDSTLLQAVAHNGWARRAGGQTGRRAGAEAGRRKARWTLGAEQQGRQRDGRGAVGRCTGSISRRQRRLRWSRVLWSASASRAQPSGCVARRPLCAAPLACASVGRTHCA